MKRTFTIPKKGQKKLSASDNTTKACQFQKNHKNLSNILNKNLTFEISYIPLEICINT